MLTANAVSATNIGAGPTRRTQGPVRFLLFFVACYVALEVGYLLIPDTLLAALYHYVILIPVVWLTTPFYGSDGLHAAGNTLLSGHVALTVVRGCDGAGFLFLLIAAIVSTEAVWKRKWLGCLLAAALVYLVNEFRLAALYAVERVRPDWFSIVHVYVLPLLLITLSTLFFMTWLQRSLPESASRG
jgi:exosortase family protein XrtM